jgi:hypothetical protein
MSFVFISHSQYDKQEKKFFAETIYNTRILRPLFMEDQNLNNQNAGLVIKNNIMSNDCKFLVVLIGKRILFPPGYHFSFTHNWVGFEVGVASCANKPIIVFEEDFENLNDIVPFPIPFLNHYVRYKQDDSNSNFIARLLSGDVLLPKEFPGKNIRCPFAHCRAKYTYRIFRAMGKEERMPCPACRGLFRPSVDRYLTRDNRSDIMPSNV